jgi:Derlin-2/3
MTFLRALILAMVYTVTQSQRGMKASFYFVTIPAQLTPYAMMAINLLLPGGPMTILLQLQGLVAAHLFEFCTRIWPQTGGNGRSLLPTPPFLTRLVNRFTGQGAAGPRRPGEPASSGSSTGRSTGPLPDSWRSRGAGHRLG